MTRLSIVSRVRMLQHLDLSFSKFAHPAPCDLPTASFLHVAKCCRQYFIPQKAK